MKTKRNQGSSPSTHGNNQNRNKFACLSFIVDPLNWLSLFKIGEMAGSTTAWCSRAHSQSELEIISDIVFSTEQKNKPRSLN